MTLDHQAADQVKIGSDRSFGFVFAVFFLLIGVFPLIRLAQPHLWALVLAAILAVVSMAVPAWLHPFNRLWFRFGLLLHRVVTPLVMGALFLIAVVPTGLIMRALRKDLLRLRFDPSAGSYWVVRQPPGPAADSFSNQF